MMDSMGAKRRRVLAWLGLAACLFVFSQCSGYTGDPTWTGDDSSASGGSDDLPSVTSPAPLPLPSSPSLQSALQSPSQKIEEADLVRRQGKWLYSLHVHRGLLIFNLEDPTKPRLVGHAPLLGVPVEMYVSGTVAYVLVQNVHLLKKNHAKMEVKVDQDRAQLILVDLRRPERPVVLGRLSIPGDIREGLSLKQGHTVYVTTYDRSKTLEWQGSRHLRFRAARNSGLWVLHAIKVQDPERPKLLGATPIMGGQEEGDFDHVVSSQVSDPPGEEPGELGDDELLGEFKQSSPRYTEIKPTKLSRVVLTAKDGYLLVAENWQADVRLQVDAVVPELRTTWERVPHEVQRGCRTETVWRRERRTETVERDKTLSFPVTFHFTVVNVFRLAGGSGSMEPITRFRIQGALTDKFKQTIQVKDSGELVYVAVLRRHRVNVSPHFVWSEVENVVQSFSLASGLAPRLMDTLVFGKTNETVRGTLFDLDRGALYAITATGTDTNRDGIARLDTNGTLRAPRSKGKPPPPVDVDPLYAIDISDPRRLRVRSWIDKLSGDIQLFRPIENGRFLLAVGRDTSAGCTGFDPSARSYSRAAVSLIDVQNINTISLVQRRCAVVRPDLKEVQSRVNWDRDEAHKRIAVYEFRDTHLLAVPVFFTTSIHNATLNKTQEVRRSAVSLMRWDLTKYNPSLPARQQTVLEDLGTLNHPRGEIDRTLFVPDLNPKHSLVAVNLSQEALVVHDLTDLSQLSRLHRLFLHTSTRGVYAVGSHLIVRESQDPIWQPHAETWRIYPLDPTTGARGAPVKELSLSHVQRVLRWKQSLLVFSLDTNDALSLTVVAWKEATEPAKEATAVVHPAVTLAGSALPPEDTATQAFASARWSEIAQQPALRTKHGLVFLQKTADDSAQVTLFFLDLRDPKKPALHKLSSLEHATKALLWTGQGDAFVLALESQASGEDATRTTTPWRWDGQTWKPQPAIPLPATAWFHGRTLGEKGLLYVVSEVSDAKGQRTLSLLQQSEPDATEPWTAVQRLHNIALGLESIVVHEGQLWTFTPAQLYRLSVTEKGFVNKQTLWGGPKAEHWMGWSDPYLVTTYESLWLKGVLLVLPDWNKEKPGRVECFLPSQMWHHAPPWTDPLAPSSPSLARAKNTVYAASGLLGLQRCELPAAKPSQP